jgi:hypothetical protein
MSDAPKDLRQALMDGINTTELSMSGFERLQAMLKAIRHIASENQHIATLVDESLLIAADFHNMVDCDRGTFQAAWDAMAEPETKEVSHG